MKSPLSYVSAGVKYVARTSAKESGLTSVSSACG